MTDHLKPIHAEGPDASRVGVSAAQERLTPFRRDWGFGLSSLLAVSFVLCSVIFVLGNYQTTNGDYYQYQIHADNLREGLPWATFLEGYPSVLPGWSVMLAMWQTVFGNSLFAVGLLNSILWALTALVYSRLLLRLGWGWGTRLAVTSILLLSPFVISFQQEGQPNIFAALSVAVGLWATYVLAEERGWPRSRLQWLAVAALLLASVVRIESVILYIATALFFASRKRWVALVWPALGSFVSIALTAAFADESGLRSNIGGGLGFIDRNLEGAGTVTGGLLWFNDYLSTCLGLLSQMVDVFSAIPFGQSLTFSAQTGYSHSIGVGTFAILALVAVGMSRGEVHPATQCEGAGFRTSQWLTPLRLLLPGTVAFWALLGLSVVPERYLLPAAPAFLAFAVIGVAYLVARLRRFARSAGVGAWTAVVLINVVNLPPDIHYPRQRNFVGRPDSMAMFDVMADEALEQRPIGYWKPRLMMGELRKREALLEQVRGIRSEALLRELLDDGGAFGQIEPWMPDWMIETVGNYETVCPVWRQGSLVVIAPPDSERPCLPPKTG